MHIGNHVRGVCACSGAISICGRDRQTLGVTNSDTDRNAFACSFQHSDSHGDATAYADKPANSLTCLHNNAPHNEPGVHGPNLPWV